MLAGLKDRMMSAARSPNAERALFVVSFAESSFFPLPPDLMLGPMAAAEPRKWLRYALICTLASVLGGLAGYAIGMFLLEGVGRWIIDFYGYGDRLEQFRSMYDEWGIWVVAVAGLTPFPYKLVTIASGMAAFSIPIFITASAATRGLRFLMVAWVFHRFGPMLAPMMEKRLGLVLSLVAVAVVAGFVALRFLH
jgi:membrane protein YqaA with SNARE-associated domain